MCESHAYLVGADQPQLLMENVASLGMENSHILLTDLLGDQMRVSARISEIDFTGHRILLTLVEGGQACCE